jgi:hypothetical protein
MAVPKCYLFSIHMANIHSKEIKSKFFSSVEYIRIAGCSDFIWPPNNLFHPLHRELVRIFSRKCLSTNSSQIIRPNKGTKICLHILLIILIVRVVIFAGAPRTCLRNDIQTFLDSAYFLSSSNCYCFLWESRYLKVSFRRKFWVENFMDHFFYQSHVWLLRF